eukprot:TRINITY_DN21681_c0_g1_i2.p1 TRINITY_DN21681_c0_g1~~TRINITY_DN21681_c0_g1_i2.p1  ORF type:complete len:179 (-),score=15.39 TRINITY_DN21681_c0_g1_i2:93-629(-)
MIVVAVVLFLLFLPLGLIIALRKLPWAFVALQSIFCLVMVSVIISNTIIGVRLIRILRSNITSAKGTSVSQAFQLKITKYMLTFSGTLFLILVATGIYAVIGLAAWPYVIIQIIIRTLEAIIVAHFVYLLGRRPPPRDSQPSSKETHEIPVIHEVSIGIVTSIGNSVEAEHSNESTVE